MAEYMFSDVQRCSTDSSSSYDDNNPLETKGFSTFSENVGSYIRYDRYYRHDYSTDVQWGIYEEVVTYCVQKRENSLRNLCLTILNDDGIHRRISLTRNRFLSLSDDH